MFLRLISLTFCLFLTSACAGGSPFATTYGPDRLVGGYKDKEVEPGIWRIQGRANGVARRGLAKDIAAYRAAELMSEQGFEYFQVIDQKGSTQGVSIGGGSPSYAGQTQKIWIVGLGPDSEPFPCRAENNLVCSKFETQAVLERLGPVLGQNDE